MRTATWMGVLGCFLLWASLANAEDPKKVIAKRHFETGTQYYNTADYEAAISEFQKAYKMFPVPKMLFNIGRCHEALGQLRQAVDRYEEFLRKDPNAPEAAMLKERIHNIKRRIKPKETTAEPKPVETKPVETKPAEPTAEPAKEPTMPPLDEPAPEPKSDNNRLWKIIGWSAIGVGGAALITGAVLGGMASAKSSDYQTAYDEHKPYAEAKDLLDSAESLQMGSIVSLSVGGAIAATGAVILILKRDSGSEQESASWRIRPSASGLAVDF